MSSAFAAPTLTIDLSGQVALVTGASSGLGRRFAQTLAAAGAAVVLAARRVDRLEGVAEDIRARGGKAIAVELDACDPVSIRTAVQRGEEALGLISILVNNAGLGNTDAATQIDLEAVDNVINTNLRAPFLLSAEVARRLIAANKSGRIVNISSVGAYTHSPHVTAALYCSTKSAVLRLTETLAMEWAPHGINVNGIAPGLFRTEMSEAHMANADEVAKMFPRKRIGDPAQLDSTLLYLVAPASEFVTGICILVDDAQFPR